MFIGLVSIEGSVVCAGEGSDNTSTVFTVDVLIYGKWDINYSLVNGFLVVKLLFQLMVIQSVV